jgi:hypothetical protein
VLVLLLSRFLLGSDQAHQLLLLWVLLLPPNTSSVAPALALISFGAPILDIKLNGQNY